MSQTIAAAIAAAAFGFVLHIADMRDADPPSPELQHSRRMILYMLILPSSIAWAIDAPSWASAINRAFMPAGVAQLAAITGDALQAAVPLGRWRRWLVGGCFLLAIGACSLGFPSPDA
jgi:hypothetical protein